MNNYEKFMKTHVDVNQGLWELCKYQHDQIKQYKEFIEQTILVKILENYKPAAAYAADDPRRYDWYDGECRVLEVKIPETRFMMLQTPNVRKRWDMLDCDTPVVKPEIYLNLMYKAAEEEKKNADSD